VIKAPLHEGNENVAKAKEKAAATEAGELAWVDAGDGYALALDGDQLVARNAKGARLSAVPKSLKDGAVAEELLAVRTFLAAHERECRERVETWMLRSLPAPRALVEAVWADPAWRAPLENAVVVALDAAGEAIDGASGLCRGVDAARGVGVVDLDGETRWIESASVAIPHPILIPELNDFRALATELGVTQGIAQLFRETFTRPAGSAAREAVEALAGAKFAQLVHALGKARTLGYRVRGGFVVCPVWEGGVMIEARYWLGADDPMSEAYTGDLSWVDAKERALALTDVGPVAWSEGMRMASGIYAARVVEEKGAA
jgi:hypothetical protein